MSNLIQYIIQYAPEEELRKKQSQTLLSREHSSRQDTDKNYKFNSRHLLENNFNSLMSNKSVQNKEEGSFMNGLSNTFNNIKSDKKYSSVNIKFQDLKISNKTENQTPTPWAKSSPKIDIKQEIKNPPISINGNEMSAKDRIDALKSGKKIYINIADNPNASGKWTLDHSHSLGEYYINKYTSQIEKYAKQYNLDPDIAKSILYSEASDYHRFGMDHIADLVGLSSSVRPMNIQGKTWGNFQGKQYDVNDPEQNIELGVRVLKSIYDAVPDKDIAKIATLWNGTGLKEVNDYGARAKEYYKNKSWNNPLEMPKIKSKKGK
jgi:hypothetical protein